jgi:hypothetical protein
VPLEFLLAASQGCLIGLNFKEAPTNFSGFLSGHAAMFVKFHGVTRHDRLPFHACVARASAEIYRSAASTPFCRGVTAVCYQTIAQICSGDMVDVPQFHTGQDEIGRADVDDISRGLNWSEMGLAALTDGARSQEQLLPRKR